MIGNYTDFLIASTGASAAFIGLLFVGMSIVNSDDSNYATRERRSVLAGTSFLALVDVFFVSIVSLAGGARTFAVANLLVATIGLFATIRLVRRAFRAGNFARNFATRRLNLVFASVSVSLYTLQLVLAIALLNSQHSTNLVRLSLLAIVGLYGSALARTWEITGIRIRPEISSDDRLTPPALRG
jgi:hypothetical protein